MDLVFHNVDNGMVEAFCRGLRSGFLTQEEYRRLWEADNLEDFRSALEETEYGYILQDDPSPLAVPTILMRCRQKLASEFQYIRSQASDDLTKFLDFITMEKMIDNIIGLIQGSLNRKGAEELIARLDPLGWFPKIKAIASMDFSVSYNDLYRILLIDSPVGEYFEEYLEAVGSVDSEGATMSDIAAIFSEADTEILRNVLKKLWLEDFYKYVQTLGGTTQEVMEHILKTEADYRVLTVTMNSINTPLGAASQLNDRSKLYPSFGYLYPSGTDRIRRAWNEETLQEALQPFKDYLSLYEECRDYYIKDNREAYMVAPKATKSLEDLVYVEEVKLGEYAFSRYFHYGIFYALVKLREQEIRNIVWIADMILLKQKDQVTDIVPIFAPKV